MKTRVGPALMSAFAAVGALAATTLLAVPAVASMPITGPRLAFVRSGNIYATSASGSGPVVQLTTAGGSHPEWSADGKQLTYEQGGYVWTMKANGSGKVRHWPGRAASWSPDGKSLA